MAAVAVIVGTLTIHDLSRHGGSLPGGLRLYVGSSTPDDGGYGAKVMAERGRLRDVAHGRTHVNLVRPRQAGHLLLGVESACRDWR